jgi:hypothetical protein
MVIILLDKDHLLLPVCFIAILTLAIQPTIHTKDRAEAANGKLHTSRQ